MCALCICTSSKANAHSNEQKTTVKHIEIAPNTHHRSGDWMTMFYLYQNIDGVVADIKFLDEQKTFANGNAYGAITDMFSNIFNFYPESADKITSIQGLSFMGQKSIIQALAMASMKEKAAQAAKNWGWNNEKISKIGQIRPQNPEDAFKVGVLTDPASLDYMWTAFFVSKDERFVHKIIEAAEETNTNNIASQAALWSLGSNVKQHEIIRRIVEKESQNTKWSENLRKKLSEMIKIEKPNFTHSVDLFGADLAVISQDYAHDWYHKSSSEGIEIKKVSELKKGESVEITIFFGGMELDKDLNADITYDITITHPDGSIGYEHKGREALKYKIPTRFSVYKPKDIIVYECEDGDMPGVYKINATIYDNIGGNKLDMESEFTLLE
jgi:hypothetical protein